jgi:cysteine desulfurase
MDHDRIYLDHNATTPLRSEVLDAMLPYLGAVFGNPSSIHTYGQEARRAVDRARQQVAELIGARPAEIIFTSGGTEADNLALRGRVIGVERPHVVTSAVEHPAVLNTCRDLERRGGVEVTYLPVDASGQVDPSALEAALTSHTCLVSVMLANNDVGTLQPLEALAQVTTRRGLPLHTDAVQAAGKLPLDVDRLGVDLLALSSHKIYGPKGSGALYVRQGTLLAAQLTGGEHERGRRAGTENVAAIVGFGEACALAKAELEREVVHLTALRDQLQTGILTRVERTRVNGLETQRLPNTLNIGFSGLEGEDLLLNLDLLGVAASTGSACSSGTVDPSHVLIAMGQTREQAASALRFSLGRDSTEQDVDQTLTLLEQVVAALRS